MNEQCLHMRIHIYRTGYLSRYQRLDETDTVRKQSAKAFSNSGLFVQHRRLSFSAEQLICLGKIQRFC